MIGCFHRTRCSQGSGLWWQKTEAMQQNPLQWWHDLRWSLRCLYLSKVNLDPDTKPDTEQIETMFKLRHKNQKQYAN